ncbi:hypothetical protein [Chryseobacterium joostei]|uniref:hypothetical protein n=1 Tax=Chryseobacterium joostei TaxID=112234 RepID=UPI003D12C0F7
MKGSTFGYILGLIVGIPLFALGVNHFFFQGNNATYIEVNTYLQNSKIETFNVDKWVGEGSEQYIVALQRGSNSAFLEWFTFYEPRYKKYFNLYMFTYLEDNQQGSQRTEIAGYFDRNIKFTASVNQEQLDNSKYGSKENPVPVWPRDLLEYDGEEKSVTQDSKINNQIKRFHVKPEINAIFIQQYLSRFMPKDEYKAMFKK